MYLVSAFLKKYRPALWFVLRFFGVYTVLTLLYSLFLKPFKNLPDIITQWVAWQSKVLVSATGFTAETLTVFNENFVRLWINGIHVANVVEGCNSVNVLILFTTFVLAFKGPAKATVLFLLAGMASIYLVNLLRIGILAIGIYKFPQYTELLHQVVFPVIIYGYVFLLWMWWVNKFSLKK